MTQNSKFVPFAHENVERGSTKTSASTLKKSSKNSNCSVPISIALEGQNRLSGLRELFQNLHDNIIFEPDKCAIDGLGRFGMGLSAAGEDKAKRKKLPNSE